MSIGTKLRNRAYRAWLSRQSLPQLKARIERQRGVLGLCYHALSDALDVYPYRTSPEAFDAQLLLLKEVFQIVPVAQAVAMLKGETEMPTDKPVAMICFDDGYRCNWTQATPVLERHNVPATLFAPRDLIRQPGATYLSETELVTLAAHPLWEVGCHGVTHNVLTGFVPEDQAYELEQSAIWLHDLLGPGRRGFAYPQGQISASVVAATRAHFTYGLATDQRIVSSFDPYQIRRFCPMRVHDDVHVFAQAVLCTSFECA